MSYRVVYGETMPAWEKIFDTKREANAFVVKQKNCGDKIFSVEKVIPGEPPQSLIAMLNAQSNLKDYAGQLTPRRRRK